jgi:hypothetical protein
MRRWHQISGGRPGGRGNEEYMLECIPVSDCISADKPVENPGISYSELHFLIPDSRAVFNLIFTLSHITHH